MDTSIASHMGDYIYEAVFFSDGFKGHPFVPHEEP